MTITIALLVALMLSATFWFKRKQRTFAETVARVSECGHVEPPPTQKALKRFRLFARLLQFIQVGKIEVVGRENLAVLKGGGIFAANHPSYADAAIFPLLLRDFAVRFIAHAEVFKLLFGLGGYLASSCGALVAQDKIKDHGARVRSAAAKLVAQGQTLMILPEGLTNFNSKMMPLKEGAVRIAFESASLKKPAWIVPAFIRYRRYPGDWIHKFDRTLQYLIVLALFPFYRRGATVVIGKPISSDELPQDFTQATEFLRQRIQDCDYAG